MSQRACHYADSDVDGSVRADFHIRDEEGRFINFHHLVADYCVDPTAGNSCVKLHKMAVVVTYDAESGDDWVSLELRRKEVPLEGVEQKVDMEMQVFLSKQAALALRDALSLLASLIED